MGMKKESSYIVSVQGDDQGHWIWIIYQGFTLIEQSTGYYPNSYAAMDAGKRRREELDEGAG